eukprot:738577-Amphidinium_carterae.1
MHSVSMAQDCLYIEPGTRERKVDKRFGFTRQDLLWGQVHEALMHSPPHLTTASSGPWWERHLADTQRNASRAKQRRRAQRQPSSEQGRERFCTKAL